MCDDLVNEISKMKDDLVIKISNLYDSPLVTEEDIKIWIKEKNFPYPDEISIFQLEDIKKKVTLMRNLDHADLLTKYSKLESGSENNNTKKDTPVEEKENRTQKTLTYPEREIRVRPPNISKEQHEKRPFEPFDF